MNYRKINKNEFDKLKSLFPDDDSMWEKYRIKRFKEFDNNEIDVFVVEDDNNFVGEITVNYVSHALSSETIPNKRVYLEAFRLDEKYQGKGFGQKLLSYALDYLKSKKYSEFTIGVEDDNEVAKHIYFKYGFTKAIDTGHGDEFDSCDYTLYLLNINK